MKPEQALFPLVSAVFRKTAEQCSDGFAGRGRYAGRRDCTKRNLEATKP